MSGDGLQALHAEWSRRHPEDPWAWARAHRTINGRPLVDMPALAEIARDDHPFVVIQKSAQVGITELLVSMALWTADSGYAGRGHALYLMPTADQMRDFAQGRFDRAIQESSYLRRRLLPEPPARRGADNVRLKKIGRGYIYMRSSESPRQVASVDADLVVLDEFDQMADGIIDLAQRRLGSSRAGRTLAASTPRYPETGINGLFQRSDQRHYLLPCGHCGLEQALNFTDNVDHERLAVVCVDCREPIDVTVPGRWEATAPGNRIRGYHFSRLYAPWLNVRALVEASEETTLAGIQEFQNSDLGEVFSPPGGSASLAELDAAREDYSLNEYAGQGTALGVDVGRSLHVVIRSLPRDRNERSRTRRLWFAGEVGSFGELDGLMDRFNVQACVIDGQPEGHAAREFARNHGRKVWLAQYRQAPGHERTQDWPRRYLINRVEALDEVFEAFRHGDAPLPRDARSLGGRLRQGIGEYYRELLVPVRVVERDAAGNWTARYIDHNKADHYAHAEVYCRMAAAVPPRRKASVSSA